MKWNEISTAVTGNWKYNISSDSVIIYTHHLPGPVVYGNVLSTVLMLSVHWLYHFCFVPALLVRYRIDNTPFKSSVTNTPIDIKWNTSRNGNTFSFMAILVYSLIPEFMQNCVRFKNLCCVLEGRIMDTIHVVVTI